MQLTYRGIKYESSLPAIEIAPSKLIGIYRGVALRTASYTISQSSQQSTSMELTNLKYRGITYYQFTRLLIPNLLVEAI
jgi:hypothetical protein